MLFEYSAFNLDNKKITASIDADSAKDARRILKEQSLQVFDIKEVKQKTKSQFLQHKLAVRDIVSFSRQLASLISASVPIDESLKTIMSDNNNKKLSGVVAMVHSSIISGSSLNQALKETNMFDDYFVASIRSGERGSNLAQVLEILSIEVEKQYKFKKKISAALVYPVTVMIVVILVISGLLTFVVPQITSVFIQNGQELPALTIMIVDISDFMVNYKSLILVTILGTVLAINILLKNYRFKFLWHKVLGKIPLIGRLVIIANATRFSRALSLLHISGTPMIESLNYSSEVVKFLPMRKSLEEATQKVVEGSSLYLALSSKKALPGIMMYMIASGEKSSNLASMLGKAADNGEYELEDSTQKIINAFMPMMVLFMGVVVLIIVLSILLPIFEMNDAVL